MISFERFCADLGYQIPAPVPDGEIHRFAVGDRRGDLAGWYALYGDGYGVVGDWRSGEQHVWTPDGDGRTLSSKEKAEFRRLRDEATAKVRAAQEQQHADAKQKASEIWAAAGPCPPDHPYLKIKAAKPHGIRADGRGRIIVPVFRADGKLSSLQYIGADGEKRFLTGGQIAGGSFRIPGDDTLPVLLCEGYATGATLHEVTGCKVVVGFNAGNLVPVAKALKQSGIRFVVCGDNDTKTAGNPGKTKATEASHATGSKVTWPTFPAGKSGSDFNDLAAACGPGEVVRQLRAGSGPWTIASGNQRAGLAVHDIPGAQVGDSGDHSRGSDATLREAKTR